MDIQDRSYDAGFKFEPRQDDMCWRAYDEGRVDRARMDPRYAAFVARIAA